MSKGELLLPDGFELEHQFLPSDLNGNIGSSWVLRLPIFSLKVPHQLSGSPAYWLRTWGLVTLRHRVSRFLMIQLFTHTHTHTHTLLVVSLENTD